MLHGQWRIGKERRRHPLRERAGLCISSASPTATVAPPTAAGGLDGGRRRLCRRGGRRMACWRGTTISQAPVCNTAAAMLAAGVDAHNPALRT